MNDDKISQKEKTIFFYQNSEIPIEIGMIPHGIIMQKCFIYLYDYKKYNIKKFRINFFIL